MVVTVSKALFMELANLIKTEMGLYINTEREMATFMQTYPEQYYALLKKAQAALKHA